MLWNVWSSMSLVWKILITTVGLSASFVTLAVSDPFRFVALPTTVLGINYENKIAVFSFKNTSDFPMQNTEIFFLLRGKDNQTLFLDVQEESLAGWRFAKPFPMDLQGGQEVFLHVGEEHAPDLEQTETALVCYKFDGRLWFHRASHSFLLTKSDQYTAENLDEVFGIEQSWRNWSIGSNPECDTPDWWW